MSVRACSFVGRLASGKRVYVRRLVGDRSTSPIVRAVFADVNRDGKMVLMARFHDPPLPGEDRQMHCLNGMEHGVSACSWAPTSEPLSVADAARWRAHWWSHVAEERSEVVELSPVAVRP